MAVSNSSIASIASVTITSARLSPQGANLRGEVTLREVGVAVLAVHSQSHAAVDDNARVLGVDHPDTSTSRNNLAGAYWSIGRRAEAAGMFADAAGSAQRLFGAEHEVSRALRANLEQVRRTLDGEAS